MTIKLNAPESQLEGLAVNSAKLVTAVAVFLILMTTLIGSVSKVRAVNRGENGLLSNGPHTVLPGALRASRQTAILVEFPAGVSLVPVTPGDTVEAGQLIVVLESQQITLSAQRTAARLKQARNALAALQAKGDESLPGRIRREEYESALRDNQAARKRVAAFEVEGQKTAYQDAKSRSRQMRNLLEQRLVTTAELEHSLREEHAALQSYQSVLEHYSRLQQESAQTDSRLRITRLRMEQYEGSEIRVARRELEEAKIDFTLADKRLKDLKVVAPRAGTILSVNVDAGDRVFAGSPLMYLSDLSTLRAEVAVSPKVARQIAVGAPVAVRVPTEPPREISSAVQSVLLVPDSESQGYLVRISIPNPDPGVILAGLDCAVVFPHIQMGESWLNRLF